MAGRGPASKAHHQRERDPRRRQAAGSVSLQHDSELRAAPSSPLRFDPAAERPAAAAAALS